ncbi:uncharacterized protein LOC133392910 [Anopheles gambiae]|uniref:uncharacterized protein LOC133392910 n=1 Tax=Anopheles gambiae TaxID=7165 RepID=UPI002AC8F0A7|nr:uncharacterized protein LOC133392910 [Anopheles gambiae]
MGAILNRGVQFSLPKCACVVLVVVGGHCVPPVRHHHPISEIYRKPPTCGALEMHRERRILGRRNLHSRGRNLNQCFGDKSYRNHRKLGAPAGCVSLMRKLILPALNGIAN